MLKQYDSLADLMDVIPWIRGRWAGRELQPERSDSSHAYVAGRDVETYDKADGCCMLGMLDYYLGATQVNVNMYSFADPTHLRFDIQPTLLVEWLHNCSIVVGKHLATEVFMSWKEGHTFHDYIEPETIARWDNIPSCNDDTWVNLGDMQDLGQAVEQYGPFQNVVKLTRLLRDDNQPLSKKLELARPFFYNKVQPYLLKTGYPMSEMQESELTRLMQESNLI